MEELGKKSKSGEPEMEMNEKKYLTFALGKREFGLDIERIEDMIGVRPVPTLPRPPGFVKGIVNLEGKVIPVVDLRSRLPKRNEGASERTCILIVDLESASGTFQKGILLNSAANLLQVPEPDGQLPLLGTRLQEGAIPKINKMKVRGIVGAVPVTAVPHSAPYLKGTMNFRGQIIPVVDLRIKLGLEGTEYTEWTCILVVEVREGNQPTLKALVVDYVFEIMTVERGDIAGVPVWSPRPETTGVIGITRSNGGVVLLDIDQIFNSGESAIAGIEKDEPPLLSGRPGRQKQNRSSISSNGAVFSLHLPPDPR